MARGAAAPLHQPAMDGKPRIVEIEKRHQRPHLFTPQEFRILARQPHGVAAPRKGIALPVGMIEIDHAPLRHHRVEIQLLLEPFPQLQRIRIERLVALEQIIGPHDGGVAPDIARAEIALLQHRHIGDAVVLGEIIGRRQAMPAAADNDHVIVALRLRLPPRWLPALVARKPLPKNRKCGIFHGCARA